MVRLRHIENVNTLKTIFFTIKDVTYYIYKQLATIANVAEQIAFLRQFKDIQHTHTPTNHIYMDVLNTSSENNRIF